MCVTHLPNTICIIFYEKSVSYKLSRSNRASVHVFHYLQLCISDACEHYIQKATWISGKNNLKRKIPGTLVYVQFYLYFCCVFFKFCFPFILALVSIFLRLSNSLIVINWAYSLQVWSKFKQSVIPKVCKLVFIFFRFCLFVFSFQLN